MTEPVCPAWEGARNAADLGGLPCSDGGVTAWGRVWRSAAPEWITDAGWRAASLREIDVAAYLAAAGLADEEITALRRLSRP